MAASKAELDVIAALLDAMETCHICHGQISLADEPPTHCEDCSWDCDEHDEPDCESVFWLHHKAKMAVKGRPEASS